MRELNVILRRKPHVLTAYINEFVKRAYLSARNKLILQSYPATATAKKQTGAMPNDLELETSKAGTKATKYLSDIFEMELHSEAKETAVKRTTPESGWEFVLESFPANASFIRYRKIGELAYEDGTPFTLGNLGDMTLDEFYYITFN